jgi:hypothetical protein
MFSWTSPLILLERIFLLIAYRLYYIPWGKLLNIDSHLERTVAIASLKELEVHATIEDRDKLIKISRIFEEIPTTYPSLDQIMRLRSKICKLYGNPKFYKQNGKNRNFA